jgi:hypothetical protein
MVLRDLPLVGSNEVTVTNDLLTCDIETVDPVRPGEDQSGDRIGRSTELQSVGAPDSEVGAFPGRELADVGAAQDGRTASRPQP